MEYYTCDLSPCLAMHATNAHTQPGGRPISRGSHATKVHLPHSLRQVTMLTVTVTSTLESSGGHERGAKSERLFLMVALPSGSDMPVMDSALAGGKCDPYCKVLLSSLHCGHCTAVL